MDNRWCDKCTEYVTVIDGEELGDICPTCKTGFYLDLSINGREAK